MAVQIITKNSSTAGLAPSAGQLVQGELAVNVTDKKLYTLDAGGNVVLLAPSPVYDVPVTITTNSSSDALTVTQSGSGGGVVISNVGPGNSLVVEDSANPDTSPFVIDASGNVGIGKTVPTEKLDITGNALVSGSLGINTLIPGSTLDVKGTLRLSGSSSGYVGLSPAASAGSVTYTLPSSDGANGQVLSTNGSGALSWVTGGGGGGGITTGKAIAMAMIFGF